MDANGIKSLLEAGPYGIAALLALAVIFLIRHIITLYKEKDDIRLEQINDTKQALQAVAKSTDNLASAEDRMTAQTEATKELVAMARGILNKGAL